MYSRYRVGELLIEFQDFLIGKLIFPQSVGHKKLYFFMIKHVG